MIKIEDVSYLYPDGTKALDNLTLHISKGERVSVIGNNGSGKTTLALLINGILRAHSGTVRIAGLDPGNDYDSAKLKQKVGLVFQNPDNQLVSTTVEREIAFSLENMNVACSEMRDKVERMLGFFGLAPYRTRLTSDLSGGEKQRLALASVMVTEPEIIIFDEPESYLDESGKQLLNDAIDLLLKEKEDLTVLRITQYSQVAEKYERMIIFNEGWVMADSSPELLFPQMSRQESHGIYIPLRYRINSGSLRSSHSEEAVEKATPVPTETKSIEVKSVFFKYDESPDGYLFEDLELNMKSNRVYGLVGRSGSGKTTLIQLMAGLLKPLSGKISYHGFDPRPGQLAVSFQQPERQFFLETVDKEIRFAAENLALKDIDTIARNCYASVGLDRERFHNRNPFTLSGGEKRRLAFATILSLEPSFIFFDEPTCALDSDGIDLFKKLVIQLKADGAGIVIVSHYGDIVFELTDEIIALESGWIESVNSKEQFFREADFSGYLSMPELIAYQISEFGEIRYFSEADLIRAI